MTADDADRILTTANPILPGFNPDPSICRVGDDFFLATSSFEFWPGIPIYHSKNLLEWRLIGHALNRSAQLCLRGVPASGGVWAPTIRYHSGRRRWYIITSVQWHGSGSRTYSPQPFILSTSDIWTDEKWTKPVFLDTLGIDPDLFFDDDGKTYLCTAQKSRSHRVQSTHKTSWLTVYGCEIDLDTGRSVSTPVLLRNSPVGRGIAEGPHLYKRAGWYYLVTAEGGTEMLHRAMVFRSRSPLGPYHGRSPGTDDRPIVFNDDDPLVQRTGHVDMVQGCEGSWWAVLLGVRPQSNGAYPLGRETYLTTVSWTDDAWPVLNEGLPICLTVPGTLWSRRPCEGWKDLFDDGTLGIGWYTARTPVRDDFYSTGKGLMLRGSGYTLDDEECPSLLLRRITRLDGLWSARVQYSPMHDTEEAGAAVYQSNAAYGIVFISRVGANFCVGYRWRGSDGPVRERREVISSENGMVTAELQIRVTSTSFVLSYRIGNERYLDVGTGAMTVPASALALDGPGVWSFTGTHFGVFAQNRDQTACATSALFESVEYRPGA